jgi:hypothetical protein
MSEADGTITLSVLTGPAAGQSFEVEGDAVIGREGAHVNIADSELSRRHASLHRTAHGVVIEDLGSTNGTFVNGERVTEPMLITDSVTILVGTTELALELPAQSPHSPPVPPEEQLTRLQPAGTDGAAGDRSTTEAPAAAAAPAVAAGAESPPPAAPGSPDAPAGGKRRRALVPIIAAAVLVIAGAVAAAVLLTESGAKSHRLDIKGVVAVIEQIGGVGAPGSSQVEVSQVSGPPGGDGAGIHKVTIGPGGTVIGSVQLFFDTGSIIIKTQGRAAPAGGGSFKINSAATITGGTGAYSGASGTAKVTGLNKPNSLSTFRALGTIKY